MIEAFDNCKDNDIYYTPSNLAYDLIQKIELKHGDRVLDPYVGRGAFYNNYPAYVNKEWAEIEKGRNAFDVQTSFDWMISNPPFSKINEVLQHSCRYSEIGFGYILPAHGLSHKRINQCALDGFFINQIYSIENPKEWELGFSHFFVVWTKERNKNLGLLYNPPGTQLKLGDF